MEGIPIFIWILVAMFVIFIIVAIIIYRLFIIKRRTIIHIIKPNGTMQNVAMMDAPEQIVVEKKTYIYDKSCEIKAFWGYHIYFFYNNPNPIHFNSKNFQVELKSADVQTILESDLIQKLFSTENLDKLILVLVIVAICIGLANGVITFSQPNTATLVNNNQTIETIKQGVLMALKKG